MIETIREAVFSWYVFVSALSANLSPRLLLLDNRLGVPIVSAVLLGLIGAAAPCQLTQSVGMLAILGRKEAGRTRWRATLAYLSGKAVVYTVLGLVTFAVGTGLARDSIPVFVAVRRALGPLMVIVGLTLAGVLRLGWAPGYALSVRLRSAARQRVGEAPFLLGIAFGFSFCPTLFALFFGFLIPLALTRPDGVLYPALFALGTALPLLIVLTLFSLGGGSMRHYARQIGRGQRVVSVLAGVVLVIVGLHDTVVYWLL